MKTMKTKYFVATVLALTSLMLIAQVSDAREIKGTTRSTLKALQVEIVSTDGSKYTAPVTIVKKRTTPAGKTIYIGTYGLDVPEGQKVMMLFNRVASDGSTLPRTAARFSTDQTGLTKTSIFNMTAPPAGGLATLYLGSISVGPKLATPSINPLTNTDEDEDGISDFDDEDDDNDGIVDDEDEDEDGNGIPDDDEDMDEDEDGLPDDVDDDDDDDDDSQGD